MQMEYTQEFKDKAIELADTLGTKAAAEKLGIEKPGVISAWKRWSTRRNDNTTLSGKITKPSYEDLLAENKQLKKDLRNERLDKQILEDATAFFSQYRRSRDLK